MTERLAVLLHREADTLSIPPAPVDRIVNNGRQRSRRRRAGQGMIGLTIVCVLGAALSPLVVGRDETPAQRQYVAASASEAYQRYGAFSTGSTVHIGNHDVTLPGKVKALYYTSLGVLVRTGASASTDSAGPSHYTLIHPDGSTKGIDLRMGDRVPGTDPSSPDVAYAEPTGDHWSLVVVSLVTGTEVARTQVDGAFTWGGWEAPPVTLYSDRMAALFDRGWVEFDWTAGTTRTIPGTAGAPLDAANGRYALHHDSGSPDWRIYGFDSTGLIRTIPVATAPPSSTLEGPFGTEYGTFSPDGRYVRLESNGAVFGPGNKVVSEPGPDRFVSVETGTSVRISGQRFYGWTPQGRTLSVDAEHDTITTCDPGTGACQSVHAHVGAGSVKLGGLSYES